MPLPTKIDELPPLDGAMPENKTCQEASMWLVQHYVSCMMPAVAIVAYEDRDGRDAGNLKNLLQTIMSACHALCEEWSDFNADEIHQGEREPPSVLISDLQDALRNVRQDAMGLESVYYWPDLRWPEKEEQDEAH